MLFSCFLFCLFSFFFPFVFSLVFSDFILWFIIFNGIAQLRDSDIRLMQRATDCYLKCQFGVIYVNRRK